MSLPTTDFLSQLDEYLSRFFASRITLAARIHPQYELLWRELERTTMSGGKRIRPKIAFHTYAVLGGRDIVGFLPAAAAIEILHNSMLIHDDIIDRELTRRGSPNISGAYHDSHYQHVAPQDRRHYSDGTALLGGDLLLTEALRLFDECSLPAHNLSTARKVMHRIIFEVAGGQLLDSEAVFLPHKRADTLTIAHYKTASYSFVGPLLIGAALAGNTDFQTELEAFGFNLGIAYQFNDDLISTFGDESKTGKSTSSDLREGKITYIVESFLNTAPAKDRERFMSLFGRQDATESEIQTLKSLIQSTDAIAQTERAIDTHVTLARHALSHISIANEERLVFEELIVASVKRHS